MKKNLMFCLFITLSMFFLIMDVNAASGGYSGEGQGQGYSGGNNKCTNSGCKCTGGACMAAAAGIKFTLVNIGNSKLEALSYGYMRSVGNLYGGQYFDAKNNNGAGAIEGIILSNGDYDYGPYSKDNYVELEPFSKMKDIINNRQGGFNFYQEKLKNNILVDSNCASEGVDCVLTDEFANISVALLRRANIISSTDTLSTITAEQKNSISNMRIIIEPVYALYLNGYKDSKYIFSTLKSIAYKFASNSYYGKEAVLGIWGFEEALYKQIYTTDTLGTIINYPEYEVPSSAEERIKSFLDLSSGSGYSIAKILYDDIKCDIKSENDVFTYIDSYGKEWNNDSNGDNFKYFLTESNSGCGCQYFNNNSHKNTILNSNSKLQQIYKSICEPPVEKVCEYEKNGDNYEFYGISGMYIGGDYSKFISECGCNNSNVLSARNENSTFLNIYNSSSCMTFTTNKSEVNFDNCKVNNNTAKLTKESYINPYCKVTCSEDINFSNVQNTSTKTYKAGMKYELDFYPTVKAQKHCVVDFSYSSWANEYKAYLKTLVDSYNAVQKYSNYSSSYTSCGENGSSRKYTYTFMYSGFSINSDGLTLSNSTYKNYEYGSCGESERSFGSEKKNANKAYQQASLNIEKLKSYIKTCDSQVYFGGSNFYQFSSDLKFKYQQTILDTNAGNVNKKTIWNTDRNIDDSRLTKEKVKESHVCNGLMDGKVCTFLKEHLFDSISGTRIEKNSSNFNLFKSEVYRTSTYTYKYFPAVQKYVDPLTGIISTTKGISIGNVYDIDINATENSKNLNTFIFTELGEKSSAYNSLFNSVGGSKALTRKCYYGITNDLFADSPKLNISYRTVDENNLDPNKRLGTDEGFKNWNNVKGKTVMETIEKTDTYNPDNLEYSFVLDSQTIKSIREYNSSCDATSCDPINYSYTEKSSSLECNEAGNECKSKFIDLALEDSSVFGKAFANSADGRKKWKYLLYNNSSDKWYINNGNMDATQFNNLLKSSNYTSAGVTP